LFPLVLLIAGVAINVNPSKKAKRRRTLYMRYQRCLYVVDEATNSKKSVSSKPNPNAIAKSTVADIHFALMIVSASSLRRENNRYTKDPLERCRHS
jgi:hypothetical protein